MEKLLSLVIPAYNMEKYLRRCLDSITNEKVMDKVQVLIVNDGSKDKTSEIAHEYEVKYPNYIQVVDKENGNYGSCMNVGLSLAQGKYFRSLDADDWFDTTNYVEFVEELEKTDADMLLGERYEFYEDTKEMNRVGFSSDVTFLNEDLILTKSVCDFHSFYYLSMVWGLTYKTSILRESGLRWDEGVFYTDNEFDFWPLKLVKTIRFIPYPVYVYLLGRDGQSVDLKIQKRNFKSYITVANTMVDELLNVFDKESEVCDLQLWFCFRVLCKIYPKLLHFGEEDSYKDLQAITSKLMKNSTVFEYYNNNLTCYGVKYIDAYHHNKLLLFFVRLRRLFERYRYKMVTNRTIRDFLGKN